MQYTAPTSGRSVVATALVVLCVLVLAFGAAILLTVGRPPQPLPLGTIQWLGEAGGTVDSVERVSTIRNGTDIARARGVYYIVHARIVAPFGLRPLWRDRDVEVATFSGSGGSMRDLHFAVDPRAQSVLDRITHRPGSVHLVRGASQREDLVFDLPLDVEQPGLVFRAANDPAGMLDWLFGRPWQPHRFNLRYD